MNQPYKYITVLNYTDGQVYLHDWDANTMPNAEEFVSTLYSLDEVHYMVHQYKPALLTKED
jgi:hypothetical protein